MIYDKLDNLETYAAISERLTKGLQLLWERNLSALEPGRYEVDGDDLYFMVQSYQTKEQNDTPEAHEKYIDIQYMLSGEELIGVGALSEMTEMVTANPEKDFWLWHGPLSEIKLGNGSFAVFFPQDAHAPGIAAGAPAPIRKVCVKVRI